jgi:hypothetical protein
LALVDAYSICCSRVDVRCGDIGAEDTEQSAILGRAVVERHLQGDLSNSGPTVDFIDMALSWRTLVSALALVTMANLQVTSQKSAHGSFFRCILSFHVKLILIALLKHRDKGLGKKLLD